MVMEIGVMGDTRSSSVAVMEKPSDTAESLATEPEKPTTHAGKKASGVRRRRLLRHAIRVAAGLGTLAALGRGVHLTRLAEANEFFNDGKVDVLFANHKLPAAIAQLQDDYIKNGANNLREVSVWNAAGQELTDNAMKEAQKQGKKACHFMIDGSNWLAYNPELALQSVNWTVIPHPDLERQQDYPEMFVIGADVINDGYGLENIMGTKKLMDDLDDRYGQPDVDKIKKIVEELAPGALAEKGLEAGAAAILLSAGIALPNLLEHTPMKRRQILLAALGVGASVVLPELVKGAAQANLPPLLAGESSNPNFQKYVTLANYLTDWSIGTQPQILFTLARSAILLEKAQEFSGMSLVEGEDPMDITILLGSEHEAGLPKLKQSQKYRLECIGNFLRDQIDFIRSTIREKYPDLAESEDKIIRASAERIMYSTVFQINISSAKPSLSSGEVEKFEENLARPVATHKHEVLSNLVNQVLEEAGVGGQQNISR